MHINKKGDGLNQNVYLGSQQNGGFATQTYGISLYNQSSRFPLAHIRIENNLFA